MSEQIKNDTCAYLGIDTSGKAPIVTIKQNDQRTVLCQNQNRFAGRDLASVVSQGLKQCGLDFSILAGISVSTGPGSFTGLRVGLAYAKGLATARSLALVGVSHFERINACGMNGVYDIIVIPVNAKTFYLWRKDELQEVKNKLKPKGSIKVFDTLEELTEELESVKSEERIACYAIDSKVAEAPTFNELMTNDRVNLTATKMTAESLLECAILEFANTNEESWSELEPIYGRKSMAEINFERKGN
ncbi:MAG: tRNA (adenosine(37)-N6)-threonylcarbamoyltransferase complex dimerization subunit type 1 TsaB [candidate division Zixibacteria bacterium]|nr:tRNA (adenosine(37)-N6)-threonylcarbamoyltransferase complex dimerization subunit type 1 TsaB [candidate division Zixibacteria bacterium]